ncbi:MAG: hypothetical protein Q8T03_01995 [Bacteroidota bacterium]|nr:hypothetical protein [Bacteroidota bacterium]
MRESKIDTKTGKTLYKVQPEGLPAIWIADEQCERCESYGKCLGLQNLSEDEWSELSILLNTSALTDSFIEEVKEKYLMDLSCLCSIADIS